MSEIVLLVEDNDADVLLFERAVAGAARPFPVRSVGDGEDALRYLSGAPPYEDRSAHPLPTLLLVDLKLPRKSGLEVLEWLNGHSELKHLPAVVLTSSSELEDVKTAFRLGAKAYCVKPIGFDPLRALVAAVADFLSAPHRGPEPFFAAHTLSRPSL